MPDTIQNLTVYLGSSGRCRPIFKETAARLGTSIGDKGKALVYGGMDAGLMGIIANTALEAGAKVTGIIPKSLKDSERIHPELSQTILVPDLWERKLKMFKRADAIITLPGGFGTIDELLEALYWANLGAHKKPVILLNTDGYWSDFIDYLKTLPDLPHAYLIIVETIEEIYERLSTYNITATDKTDETKTPHFEDEILSEDQNIPMIFDTATVKDSYKLATALGLKQLGKHRRPIGLINTNNQFKTLLNWIKTAQAEKFITDRCTKLYDVAQDLADLKKKLAHQPAFDINLHTEKWGPGQTKTHIELQEKE